MKCFVVFFIGALLSISCLGEDLPDFIHVCHRDAPNLEQCLVTSVEDLRPYLAKGVPEYNIPTLEPLVMHDLIREDIAGMKIETYNVSAFGCTDYFVRSLKANMETNVFTIDVDLPKLRIEANYNVDGKLLLLPVKGNGNIEANVTDCLSRSIFTGELYEKDGEKYIKFSSVDLKVKVGGGTVRLENLFNGDKILLGVLNDVLNKNLEAFIKELMPPIEKALAANFLDIANKIVQPYTYKQLFPH